MEDLPGLLQLEYHLTCPLCCQACVTGTPGGKALRVLLPCLDTDPRDFLLWPSSCESVDQSEEPLPLRTEVPFIS
jgi:hypothetical protein